MTSQALAGLFAGLLVALLVVAGLLAVAYIARRREHQATVDQLLRDLGDRTEQSDALRELLAEERVRATRSEEQAEHVRAALRATSANLTQAEDELVERRNRTPLEGRLVLVNLPKPDDQTAVRGVCRRELDDGRLIIEAAELIAPNPRTGQPERTPAGDVEVPRHTFAQIIPPPSAPTEET